MKKSRKKSKINIARLLLFISVTILWILGNNIYSNVRRFSWAEIAKANFLQTESYKSAITHEIETLEDAIYWSIWNDELESYPGLEYINRENSNIEYIADITTNTGKHIILSNLKTVIQDKEHIKSEFKESLQYYICSLNSVPDTNIDVLQKYGFKADQSRFEVLDIYVKVNLDNNGYMKTIQQNYYKANHNVKINIIGVVIFSILSIVLLYKAIKSGIYTDFFDVKILTILGMEAIFEKISIELICLILYAILAEIFFNSVRNIKQAKAQNEKAVTNFIEKIKENYKLIIIVVVVTIIAMGIISAITLHYGIVIYDVKIKPLAILIYAAIVIIFLKNVSEYNRIEKEIRNIVSGEYQSEIKTDNKYLKNMVQDINNIKKGMENAVNEKVKSERLKTDLITNVSHDLKTPLTSIINYANLLKKENIENENAQKYIEILENKSKKLKNLTEDLIEASKISSGNETVNLQKLNFTEMILQANGEFAEKYESKDLKLISKIEKEEIFAQLDSKKMWRVLENIYNNAYKYSLEGTRIYVNVEQNDKIVFTMKNISKEELNITPEELMERFVRGDKSRTSGGNGLRSFNS
ncbi:MAG: HAMP domain-containing histidine kinase [Clostridia bacterium]|nr:HAMP domain-containing histidine kinase [Clostridia bacterium]